VTRAAPEHAGRILGAVLAGGASARFGTPKWQADLEGRTLGARAVAALAPNTARVVVVGADPALRALGVEVRADLDAGMGPLGGLRTALCWARELSLEAVVLLGCDLPLVGAAVVRALVDAWDDQEVVTPFGPRGPEPLCALYAAGVLPAVEASLASRELALHRLIERARAGCLPLDAARSAAGLEDPFLNVNTPEDLARAAALLARGGVD
jgi:molybdopterin-guanine dinucleotide biosynthesis protein A